MSAPFFSVIIPVYNRAHVVGDAIRSVLDQTCQDFEIVVVDDGSQDDSASVITSFQDPRIRFIRQANAGGGAARNTAIDASKGRFIAPLDSDDVFLPHHLETMKALLENSRGTVGYARILVDRGQGRTFLKPPRAIGVDEDMAEYLLCDRGFVPTITVVVQRRIAAAVRYHEDLRTAEDTDFAIRLSLSGQRFVMAERPGAVWKDMFDPNRTSSGRRCRRFGDWLAALRPAMTPRAYHGARGWAYAKLVARKNPAHALLLYLNAALRGCYAPRLAGVVFLQIFLADKIYRALADHGIAWLKLGLREGPVSTAAAAQNQTSEQT
jgi:glycosyltransferase involved in cell wall biosynthesis